MAKKKKSVTNHSTNKTYMPRVRKEYVDMDYLKDLSDKDREWMDKFAGEYYGGNLNTQSPRKNIHKSKEKIKDCFDRNNRQNNDLYGVTQATGLLDRHLLSNNGNEGSNRDNDIAKDAGQYLHPSQVNCNITENALIEYIDNKELLDLDTKELDIVLGNVSDDPTFFQGQHAPKKKRKRSRKK